MLKKVLSIIALLIFTACGGSGGSNPVDSIVKGDRGNTPTDRSKISTVYKNSILPEIKDETLPESLLGKAGIGSEKSSVGASKVEIQSSELNNLYTRVQFFYMSQLNMNINLGYVDSVWEQIESYCNNKTNCSIPAEMITFTYTPELYNRDLQLIENYEQKSRDYKTFTHLKEQLVEDINLSMPLGAVRLIKHQDKVFDYSLIVQLDNILNRDSSTDETITNIIKWNKEHTLYQIIDKISDQTPSDKSQEEEHQLFVTSFDFIQTEESTTSSFVSSEQSRYSELDPYQELSSQELKVEAFAEHIRISEKITISYDPTYPIEFSLEGELTKSGGYIIYANTEGYYQKETFDLVGNVKSSVNE